MIDMGFHIDQAFVGHRLVAVGFRVLDEEVGPQSNLEGHCSGEVG
jgi:hypothetical protein